MARVQVLNEQQVPLSNVAVIAFPIGNTSTISSTAFTDVHGVADFPNLSANEYGFKPRITRYGTGNVHLSVLTETKTASRPNSILPTKVISQHKLVNDSQSGATALDFGVLRWDADGILQYWDDALLDWVDLSPELPTADPGGGALWLYTP